MATGDNDQVGGFLILDHGEGYESHYYHQDVGSMFNLGDDIKQGQTIGNMGRSGISTGEHLHLGIKKDGEFLDPRVFFDRRSVMYGHR